jgi:hypothetical protein
MPQRQRVFRRWVAVLTAFWVVVNVWPRNGGTLKSWFEWAGFPWPHAFWESGHLQRFDSVAFAGNVAVGFVVILSLASACAWSRKVNPHGSE